jgi:hypothetical protein
MPHSYPSYNQTHPQWLVNSQELDISRLSVSGTAFAFGLEMITLYQGKIALGNHAI